MESNEAVKWLATKESLKAKLEDYANKIDLKGSKNILFDHLNKFQNEKQESLQIISRDPLYGTHNLFFVKSGL